MKIFNLRMMLASTVLAGAVMAPVSLWAAGYQKQGRSITLSLPAKPKQAKTVRLTIVSDNIIRVPGRAALRRYAPGLVRGLCALPRMLFPTNAKVL